MGAFEYLSVLISIILALGMTRVLGGVGEMLQARSRHRIYWVHVIWIVNLFLYLVIAWWIFYRWRDQQPWNFYLFLFVLISPTILYLASLLLFPRKAMLTLPSITRRTITRIIVPSSFCSFFRRLCKAAHPRGTARPIARVGRATGVQRTCPPYRHMCIWFICRRYRERRGNALCRSSFARKPRRLFPTEKLRSWNARPQTH
jgi:hypothetical protein